MAEGDVEQRHRKYQNRQHSLKGNYPKHWDGNDREVSLDATERISTEAEREIKHRTKTGGKNLETPTTEGLTTVRIQRKEADKDHCNTPIESKNKKEKNSNVKENRREKRKRQQ